MKLFSVMTFGVLLALSQSPAHADQTDSVDVATTDEAGYILLADNEKRKERRDERGRADERQGKRDCRQEEGRVGKDKRDCKQEDVRDGVKGNQGDKPDDAKEDKQDDT
jgi:hypothetical protein